MSEPMERARESVRDELELKWREFFEANVEAGRCPYSGLGIYRCQLSICDCFDVPRAT
jgi:hypothetical protein